MKEYQAILKEVHRPLLDYELRQALGELYTGLSTYGTNRPISFWFTDDATDEHIKVLQQVLTNHNPVAELPDHLKPKPTVEEQLQAALDRIDKLESKLK